MEQATGVEPAWVGVAHRPVTWTHLLGGASCAPVLRVTVGALLLRPVTLSWGGLDSNQRLRGKNLLQSDFATSP